MLDNIHFIHSYRVANYQFINRLDGLQWYPLQTLIYEGITESGNTKDRLLFKCEPQFIENSKE